MRKMISNLGPPRSIHMDDEDPTKPVKWRSLRSRGAKLYAWATAARLSAEGRGAGVNLGFDPASPVQTLKKMEKEASETSLELMRIKATRKQQLGEKAKRERALALETSPEKRVETRVRLAGVHVDNADMASADASLDAALTDADGASVSDVHMHRAQLRVIRRDLEAAKNDLEACIAVAPGHVLARLRLATVLIHSGADAQSVEEQVEAAERLAPTMSEVYQVKGEVLPAKADLRGAIRQFDEAIRLDESNPVPLYNKGLTLIQMNQFEAHNAQKLFESALAVDPTCMVALMRLSELKLQLAASFDQAQAVVDMLGGAMQNCRDKDELVELSTVRAMAVAQLAAARDVGLTSFQM